MRSISKLVLPIALALIAAGATSAAPSTESDAAPTAKSGIEARDTRGGGTRPCPPVNSESEPYVRGGCKSTGNTLGSYVAARTAFGALPFGYQCAFSFTLHVGGDGRTWIDRIFIGGGAASPCNDIRPCEPHPLKPSPADTRNKGSDSPTDFDPWPGELDAVGDGRFVNRFDMCVDTCAGRFEGKMEFALVREDGAWIMRADGASAGTSGLAFSGEWPLDPGDFDLVASN